MIGFEWDKKKELINIEKHGINFNTAANVFKDDGRIEIYDEKHSLYEDRFITVGMVAGRLIVTVVYTDRLGLVRIISARLANESEKEAYLNAKSTNWYS